MTESRDAVTLEVRTIGRQLARELTSDEIDRVAGGNLSPNTHGDDDHSPTGTPCSDCD